MEGSPTKEPHRKRPRSEGKNIEDDSKMRVVLALCGSMSPITNLHLRLFELARDYLHQTGRYVVQRGIISIVHDGYGKKGLVSSEHRKKMVELAVQGSDWITLDSWECEQPKWLRTRVVMDHMQEVANEMSGGRDRVKLLCGADLLESFATPGLWDPDDIATIVGKYGVVAISRSGNNAEEFIYKSDQLHPLRNNIEIVTEWIANDVSSTKIRRGLRRGESVKYLVPDLVLDYIKQHDLYTEPHVIAKS